MATNNDWESVEGAYRAGILSLRAIAEKHGTKESTIRSRASTKGWQRDLSSQVKNTAKTKLSRTTSRKDVAHDAAHDAARSDNEIIEQAADEITQVVLGHRKQIVEWRGISAKLAVTLSEMEVGDDNHNDFARSLNSGVDALGKLVKLERQAYCMDDDNPERGPERALADDDLDARITELTKQVGNGK